MSGFFPGGGGGGTFLPKGGGNFFSKKKNLGGGGKKGGGGGGGVRFFGNCSGMGVDREAKGVFFPKKKIRFRGLFFGRSRFPQGRKEPNFSHVFPGRPGGKKKRPVGGGGGTSQVGFCGDLEKKKQFFGGRYPTGVPLFLGEKL